MLVLTRKLMEKVYIGENICVTVVRLEGGQVRLGIDAPREISVIRAELVDGRGGSEKPQPAVGAETGTPRLQTPATLRTQQASALGTGIRRRGQSR